MLLIKVSRIGFYPSQIKNLEEMAEREGKATGRVIREAVRRFLSITIYGRPLYFWRCFS